jgi:uncharacterized protein YejL (UPF0352 family)
MQQQQVVSGRHQHASGLSLLDVGVVATELLGEVVVPTDTQ